MGQCLRARFQRSDCLRWSSSVTSRMTDSAYRNPCDKGSSPSGARPLWKARGGPGVGQVGLFSRTGWGRRVPTRCSRCLAKATLLPKPMFDGWRVNSRTARFQTGAKSRHCMSMGCVPAPGSHERPSSGQHRRYSRGARPWSPLKMAQCEATVVGQPLPSTNSPSRR